MVYNNLLDLQNAYKKYGKQTILNGHKEALNEWWKLLDLGKLSKEIENYPKFQEYILKGILGYSVDDYEFEKSHGDGRVEYTILKDNKPYIVFEVKGTKFEDLNKKYGREDSAVTQAFKYANEKTSIEWVMVTNYNEFRLYNYNKSKERYINFKFEDLKPDSDTFNDKNIKYFLLCFSKKYVIERDVIGEYLDYMEKADIGKIFYKIYSEAREILIRELVEINNKNQIESINLAQQILNRYIFICFCEDNGLIPNHSNREDILYLVKKRKLRETEIWHELNNLFMDMNEGNDYRGINEFNSGLFREDISQLVIRDTIDDKSFYNGIKEVEAPSFYEGRLNDELGEHNINRLYKCLLRISYHDFKSDIDVNILGEIFERSIGDIEKIKDGKIDETKKGIIYTNEKITKNICENTIIPYLSPYGDTNNINELINQYKNDLKILGDKLKNIRILDPACGSGAFLNQSVDLLVSIHKAIYKEKHPELNIEENKEKFNIHKSLIDSIRNNIYGVDLNNESVEITKLSLFLKTADEKSKLPNLDKNIKTGNSLINDFQYCEQSFDWNKEFPEIMMDGGFDIVIGNPPYIRSKDIEYKPYLKHYETYTGDNDLYVYFFEKGMELLKNNGRLGFICSNKYEKAKYGKRLRKYLLQYKIIGYEDRTSKNDFPTVNVDPSIILISKESPLTKHEIHIYEDFHKEFRMEQKYLNEDSWAFINQKSRDLKNKIESKGKLIKNIAEINMNRGITTGLNEAFKINKSTRDKLIKEDQNNKDIIKPLLRGEDIKKWIIDYAELYIIFTRRGIDIDKYPTIKKYLAEFKKELTPKKTKDEKVGRKIGDYKWYEIQDASNYYEDFEKSKIIWGKISGKPQYTVDNDNYYILDSGYILTSNANQINLYYLSSLFNSKILDWYLGIIATSLGKIKTHGPQFVEQLPIIIPSKEKQDQIIKIAKNINKFSQAKTNEVNRFMESLKDYLEIKNIKHNDFTKRMEIYKYYNFNFIDFMKELKKKVNGQENKKLLDKESIMEELKKRYENSTHKINDYDLKTCSIEKEINNAIYKLYDLTTDEINTIEKNTL
ncbi:MAG: Eco57I restriction-modification methylase domain-containing protein [Methanobrevibacter sp.]|jgi:hypothetical protein|nr:Eco57I restriction-modification methylase domain-containing protein [Candidatus Methanovirga meridionalis]